MYWNAWRCVSKKSFARALTVVMPGKTVDFAGFYVAEQVT
jgi:hypothetical protein